MKATIEARSSKHSLGSIWLRNLTREHCCLLSVCLPAYVPPIVSYFNMNQVNVSLPIHPSLRRAYEILEPLFLEHIITDEVRNVASFLCCPFCGQAVLISRPTFLVVRYFRFWQFTCYLAFRMVRSSYSGAAPFASLSHEASLVVTTV